MSREIELKFDVAPGARDVMNRSGLLAGGAPERRDQAAVYFDTPAGDLRKAGFSLRIRRSGARHIQTVKHKAGSAAGMFARSEWEWPVAGFDLDFDALAGTPVARLLTRKKRKQLAPVVRTRVERTSWLLVRGQAEVELTLDEGEIEAGGKAVPVRELELELQRGPASVLFALAEELGSAVPLRLGVLSKAERGFALATGKLGRATKAEPIRLHPDAAVGPAFVAIAYSCLRQFRLNEAVLTERADPEALHQLRVAMRRLRSAFALFRPAMADSRFAGLREEIGWFTDQLNDARDLDVLSSRAGGDSAAPLLGAARDAAYAAVSEALESQRFLKLMLGLVRWLEIGGWRSQSAAKKPLGAFAARQLTRRWRKIRSEGALLRELDEEGLHDLRIDVKKMRYASEFLAALFEDGGEKPAAFSAALESLQDELGAINDGVAGRALLERLDLPAAEAGLLGDPAALAEAEGEPRLAAAEAAFARAAKAADYWRAAKS